MSVTLADITAAAQRIAGQIVATPCLPSRTLSQITGAAIYLKFENLQFTAAFKERGALNKLLQLSPEQARAGVSAMSAGNHGQAVAYHAKRLGIHAVIVMPRTTPFVKVEHTKAHGAEVVLFGDTLSEAQAHVEELTAARGLTFIHPYDDPAVIAGQGTVGLEILRDVPDLDMLVASVGGGGLISGIATAVKAAAPRIEIIGVQADSYPSMIAALKGETADCRGDTIAEGIAVKTPGRLTLEIISRLVQRVVAVDERRLEESIALLLNIEKTVVEGAGAAPLAAVLADPAAFRGRKVALVLSGGNIDPRLLASVILRELVRENRIVKLEIPLGDRPGVLSKVTSVIGDQGGNIIEVYHRRLSLDLPAKQTSLELIFEARDEKHARAVVRALTSAGFAPTRMPP
ncbi:MAG: threonine ammonia-lyase [Rhodospirillaceae bacterium]